MPRKKMIFIPLLTLLVLSSCAREKARPIEGMVYIPSGEFIMGSEDVDTEGLAKEFGERKVRYYEDEKPMRKIFLKGFYIDKYEVTNMEYKAFIAATGYPPPPTWEKAARGPNGNKYPWGNEYDEKNANLNKGTTVPVGSYKIDKSYYGVYDMGGNVMEWVDDWYKPYPGNKTENKDFGETSRILRGGSGSVLGHYIIGKVYARSSFRHYYLPGGAGDDGGIRCAKSAETK